MAKQKASSIRTTASSRQSLTLERIIAAAAALPAETLTLRAVGKALGVSGQALYRYVDSTDHLIELVAAACWPPPDTLPSVACGWYDWYRQALNLLRESFLKVPELSAHATRSGSVSPRQLAFTDAGLQCFSAAGVPPAEGILYFRLLVNATFDHVQRAHAHANGQGQVRLDTFWQAVTSSSGRYAQLDALKENHRLITAQEAFDLALSTLLAGIAAQACLAMPERRGHQGEPTAAGQRGYPEASG